MAFREVRVFEVREVLRVWLGGPGFRTIERLVGVDRKTVRRYVEAAVELGLDRGGGEEQLTDLLIAQVVERVRPHRVDGHGESWRLLEVHADQIRAWLEDDDLTVTKVGTLLARQGVMVPGRTLRRFAAELCGPRRGRGTTVRVADGEPGDELQVDFGRMGVIFDIETGRRRVCHALIFTACCSRHCFVWLTFSQTTAAVIEGFEAAWRFFGGVFRTVIPDNLAAVVDKANPTEPRLNQAFVEYAQDRGFMVDAARVRHPQDKPRVERMVSYVRRSFFAGETFVDLADAQRRAEEWCCSTAGRRIHGTTACRPVEQFALEEAPRLLPAPAERYDLPIYATAKVHRDHHIEVAKALYSIPGGLIGQRVDVRADRQLVKVFHRGVLVKTHPRQPPGHRSTDPDDLPADKTIYAMRDLNHLVAMAAAHGPAIGAYAQVLLDNPLPWTKMRQVYALLGLVKKWGADRVDAACARAAEAEAYSVSLIGRMLERGAETAPPETFRQQTLLPGRFARPPSDFATKRKEASA
ncbi:MAG: IS21 family transposase [Actinomycetota bacterium]|nr:IS21 family transposase [Actinomycetota bacterium]